MKTVWDRTKAFIFLLVGTLNIALFGALTYRWFLADTVDGPQMTRSDYLDLSLSLLQVLLAAIAILLAIAALFAYFDIRRAAERMAEQTTMSVMQKLYQGEPVPWAGGTIPPIQEGAAARSTASKSGASLESLGGEESKEEEQHL